MTEPLPLSLSAERLRKDELLAALRLEKALHAALELETRSPDPGRIGGNTDTVDAMRVTRARIAMLQQLYDRAADDLN